MRFSILIPAYNVEKYIEECILSVLHQDFDDYEIIIINDGSTDNTLEVCKKYESDKIRVFSQKNKGLMLARRAAIERANGEYCVNLDSDDKLVETALSTINSFIEEYATDILIYNLSYFDDKNQQIKARKPVFDELRIFEGNNKTEIYYRLLTSFDLNNFVLKAIKTVLLKSDNTDYIAIGDNSMGEDLIQSLYPITYANRILYTPESLYFYRKNEQSMTRIIDRSNISSCLKKYNPHVLPIKIKYLEKWNLDNNNEIRLAIYAGVVRNIIGIYKRTYNKLSKSDENSFLQLDWKGIIPDEVMNYKKHLPISFYERLQLHEILAGRTLLFKVIKIISR